jgi:hypothetical protein
LVPTQVGDDGSAGHRNRSPGATYFSRIQVYIRKPVAAESPEGCKRTKFAAEERRLGYVSIDEDDEDVTTRLGQRRGFTRDEVERRHRLPELAALMPPVKVYDGRWSLEEVVADCARRAEPTQAETLAGILAKPVVLLADSLQTLNPQATLKSEPERIAATLKMLKAAATERGWLVVVTSEMVRSAYSGDATTEAIAAGKWSGSIEYNAKLLLALYSVKNESDLVRVVVGKNKMGPRGEFYLKLDRARQMLTPVDAPTATTATKGGHATVLADAAAVAAILRARPGLGVRQLRDALAAAHGSFSKDRVGPALEKLGAAVTRTEGAQRRIHLHLDPSKLPPDVLQAISRTEAVEEAVAGA